jgi:hypothetical protein
MSDIDFENSANGRNINAKEYIPVFVIIDEGKLIQRDQDNTVVWTREIVDELITDLRNNRKLKMDIFETLRDINDMRSDYILKGDDKKADELVEIGSYLYDTYLKVKLSRSKKSKKLRINQRHHQ